MIRDDDRTQPVVLEPRALFLHDLGWRVDSKRDSLSEYCYVRAPGDEHYHRLHQGEIIVVNELEKLCIACAVRRGLVTAEPIALRDPARGVPLSGRDSVYDAVDDRL
jgi:hypothetical protein